MTAARPAPARSWFPVLRLGALLSLASVAAAAVDWPHWPLQQSPGPTGDPRQDPATHPKSTVPAQPGQRRPAVPRPVLSAARDGSWRLTGGWKLCSSLQTPATAREISLPGFDVREWLDATVPGTVLTTYVDQGVYPEPTYGLNNLAIPEALNRQDYWYRAEFTVPEGTDGATPILVFHGINYTADVWINGTRLGAIRGAFQRGSFDLAGRVRPGERVALAVRVSPVPHPGIPHEESLAAGAGPNGGAMAFDGPTFFCTEGWDWIPGIRDRCTGIWQDVELRLAGPVTVGDVQVATRLPTPDRRVAEVVITASVSNRTASAQTVTLAGTFEGARFQQAVTLAPHATIDVRFSPEQFADLRVREPRLWWPNGYGKPELYPLELAATDAGGRTSDTRSVRFGLREVSYELTAVDPAGTLQRRDYLPAAASAAAPVIDLRHEALRESPVGWVPTWTAAAASSPALRAPGDPRTGPFLVIKVNGVPIVAKGGNWGLDEALKRCSRERLEPAIRMERDAHLTMIRNWCGQNTEEAFFELCDEYGIMVWSDFWASTQNWNLQPGDLQLWLDNAADTIRRFRHHPSIVLWCGRNEGVPPPALNEGLAELIRTMDGTRHYQPGSVQINLLNSGPWVHQDPVKFFSEFGRGFTTEVGLPCAPTADAIRAMMPAADQWPISDTWAYHDWHQADHGEVQAFMSDLAAQYGEPTGLDDFCRKAQMLNYVGHRAIFEGLNAHLWTPSSGRLLWMSHPTWPSMEWQLSSSDGDTNGAYAGAQKACEPLHVQLNADDRRVVVTNTTLTAEPGLEVRAELFDLQARRIGSQQARIDCAANATTSVFVLDAAPATALPLYFVRLTATGPTGALRSENVYWQARQAGDHRRLNELPKVQLTGVARTTTAAGALRIAVAIRNPSDTLALMVKPTLRDGTGQRILPAFVDQAYVSIFPGEERTVTIETPAASDRPGLQVTLDGWNTADAVPVTL